MSCPRVKEGGQHEQRSFPRDKRVEGGAWAEAGLSLQAGLPRRAQHQCTLQEAPGGGAGCGAGRCPSPSYSPTVPARVRGCLTARDRAWGMAGTGSGDGGTGMRQVTLRDGAGGRQRPEGPRGTCALGGDDLHLPAGRAPVRWTPVGTQPRIPESRCPWRRAHCLSGIQLGGRVKY